jgi:copper(I)-binding protein
MILRSLLVVALLMGASLAHAAPAYRKGVLEVDQPWSRPAAAGMTGAGFMTETNRGKTADALVSVQSSAARKVEIHRSSMAGGVISMQRQDRVSIPPGGSVTFGPGGYHLMLIGLARPLKAGDRAPATLTFASGARIEVAFAVGNGAAPAHQHRP